MYAARSRCSRAEALGRWNATMPQETKNSLTYSMYTVTGFKRAIKNKIGTGTDGSPAPSLLRLNG